MLPNFKQIAEAINDNKIDEFIRLLGSNDNERRINALTQFKQFKQHAVNVTALELVVNMCRHNFLQYLLAIGIDVNRTTPTPLLHSCITNCSQNSMNCVRVLLSHPDINVNAVDSTYHYAALHYAVRNDRGNRALRLLLTHKDVNVNLLSGRQYTGDYTPLMCAVLYRATVNVRTLVRHRTLNTNTMNSYGQTALYFAVLNDCVMSVRQLVHVGRSNVNEMFQYGDTVMTIAHGKREYVLSALLCHACV
jgi:ankyrin repeat protein